MSARRHTHLTSPAPSSMQAEREARRAAQKIKQAEYRKEKEARLAREKAGEAASESKGAAAYVQTLRLLALAPTRPSHALLPPACSHSQGGPGVRCHRVHRVQIPTCHRPRGGVQVARHL